MRLMQFMKRPPNPHSIFMCDVGGGTAKADIDPYCGQHLLFGHTSSLRDFPGGVALPRLG